MLQTLGELRLNNSGFRREKPLLLLAYLSLEGAKPRRFLADLFWGDAKDPLNSLSVAASKLRALKVLEADDRRAWTTLQCDAEQLRGHLRERQFEAVSDYYGPFLDGLTEPVGAELEEWILQMRETIALEVRAAMVQLAERAAAAGAFSDAAKHANAALELKEAPPFEPEELARLHRVLVAADDPQSATVRREAEDFGLQLSETPKTARDHLRPTMIARERELESLRTLPKGQWAWLRGGMGMGKTVLLRELERQGWRYIAPRAGLPFATLEGLVDISDGESAIVNRFAKLEGSFAFDNWEGVDPETRDALTRLRASNPPGLRLIIASRLEPSLSRDRYVEVGAITEESLSGQTGAFELTGGHPALVGAWLRGESIGTALEAQLTAVPPEARRLYAALTLLEPPDLVLTRKALHLNAATFANALQTLIDAGLAEPSGTIRGSSTAQAHLAARPMLEAELALSVARVLGHDTRALPLYQKARALWEDEDETKIQQAYILWAKELMKRGFPARAAEMLEDAPPSQDIAFVRARAYEFAGQYKLALEQLEHVTGDTPEMYALRATVLSHLGKPELARAAAEKALEGDSEARAEGFTVLGHIERLYGNHLKAIEFFKRSAALWLTSGKKDRWADTLNHEAVTRAELGEDVEVIFEEALEAAEDNLILKATILQNKAASYFYRNDIVLAEKIYFEVIEISEESNAETTLASVWNNLGTMYHQNGNTRQAQEAYKRALELARKTGHVLFLASILSNFGELNLDLTAIEEAIRLLEINGHDAVLAEARQIYASVKEQIERSTVVQG